MANFNCSICGGQITMQATRGGVCKGCGMEYDLEAVRAMAGISIPSTESTTKHSNEIDREALLVYLNDVKVLETIISKSKAKSDTLHTAIAERKQAHTAEMKATEPRLFPEPQKKSLFSACLFFGIMLLGLLLIVCISPNKTQAVKNDLFPVFALACILCIIGINSIIKKKAEYKRMFTAYMNRKIQYDAELQEYTIRCQIMEQEVQRFITKSNELSSALHDDVTHASHLLEQAYATNIIPLHFRNIHGVYYLYDYLSTSNQTLSEALIQCNLDTIREKLDTVIQGQSEQVIQQAITNAKLGQIYQIAEATMNNTAVAAKYAQIASGNTILAHWLINKQLAYQTTL